MKLGLVLLLILIALQGVLFSHVFQGTYYFAILLAIIAFARPKNWSVFNIPLVLIWIAVWIDSLGNAINLYSKYIWYDDFSHAAVSALLLPMALKIFSVNRRVGDKTEAAEEVDVSGNGSAGNTSNATKKTAGIKIWPILLFPACSVVAIMSVYEVWEYWAERIFNLTFIWGRYDTNLDLQWNIFGVCAACSIYVFYHRMSKSA